MALVERVELGLGEIDGVESDRRAEGCDGQDFRGSDGELDRLELDRRELEILGGMLDWRPHYFKGRSTGEMLAATLLRVRGKDGRLHPLRANAAQRSFERRRGAANIVLKARQMGLTTWVAGRFLLKTITRPGTLTLQVAHTQESAEEILGIVHRFVDHLPAGLKNGALRLSKANVRQIVFPEIDSEYRVVSASDRNAGRGMTYQNLHCSEVSRWGMGGSGGAAAEVLAGLRAGLVVAGLDGAGRGSGGELVMESTPFGVGGCFYDEWQRAAELGMVRHFFPWWMESGYRAAPVEEASLTEEELELMRRVAGGLDRGLNCGLNCGLDWEDGGVGSVSGTERGFGRDSHCRVSCLVGDLEVSGEPASFAIGQGGGLGGGLGLDSGAGSGLGSGLDLGQIGYRRLMRAAQGRLAGQEFAESPDECFVLSGDPYFDMEKVEGRLEEMHKPFKTKRNGQMEYWLPPQTGRLYVVAVDPAGGGLDGDYSAIQVLDRESGQQCAEYAGHVTGLELVEVIRDIAWDYNTAWVVVERNNHGNGVLWLLEQRGYREIYRGTDGEMGFLTTSVSRPQILARMSAAIVDSPGIFNSRRLMVECRSFVRLGNGGVGARNGAHDDRVMAMALGLAGRAELLERSGARV